MASDTITGSSISLNISSAIIGTDAITVSISRASNSYTHKVYLYFGDYSELLEENVETSYTFTPDMNLCNQIPNSTSGIATIKVQTMNGSTFISETNKTITLIVPDSVKPTVTIALTYNNALNGLLIASKSTVTITPTGTGAYGSTIKSYTYSNANLSGIGSSKTTKTLEAGTYTPTVTVTDSRGRTNSVSQDITFYDYSSPKLSVTANRCNSNGTINSNGTHVKVTLNYSISNPNNDNYNTKQYKLEYKATTSTSYITDKDFTDLSSYSSNDTSFIYSYSEFVNTSSYDLKVSIKDIYSTVSNTIKIPTCYALLNIEKSGIGIGKINERGALDIKGNFYINGAIFLSNSPDDSSRIGYNETLACTYISGPGNDWLKLTEDGKILWKDSSLIRENTIPTLMSLNLTKNLYFPNGQGIFFEDSSGSSKFAMHMGTDNKLNISSYGTTTNIRDDLTVEGSITSNDSLEVGSDSNTFNNTLSVNRSISSTHQRASISVYDSDGGIASLINRNETSSFEQGVGVHADSATSGFFIPLRNNRLSCGTSTYKWTSVYATNGTIQTSDERFKIKRGFVNTNDCFDMVKDTELYKYIMLDQNKEDISKNKLGKLAMECEDDNKNIHMGIMAQDLQKYECGKHILVEDEYEKEDGTKDTMLHINQLDMTMAVMGALKQEIKYREQLESKVTELEERLALLENLLLDKKGE